MCSFSTLNTFSFSTLITTEGWKGRKIAVGAEEIEVYDRLKFFCVTGHRIEGAAHDLTDISDRLPGFLAEFFPAKPTRSEVTHPTGPTTTRSTLAPVRDVSRRERVARARGWLRGTPGAIGDKGMDGSGHTIRVCGEVIRGFDLTFDEAFPLLCSWNRKCDPPWDEDAEGGADSLRRKLRDADAHPGERGYKLTDRSEVIGSDGIAVPSIIDPDILFAGLMGPAYVGDDVPPVRTEDYFRAKAAAAKGSAGDGAMSCGKQSCEGCPTCSLEEKVREQVGRTPNHLLHDLIGPRPDVSPCPRRTRQFWSGCGTTTADYDALVWVSCDCWSCYQCRTRNRWNQKAANVPFAQAKGTHYWRGTAPELNALCKRLDRRGVAYACYWVLLDAGERAAVFAVAAESLPDVPADLQAADGDVCGRKLAHFIELIPSTLPAKAHRHGTRGPLEWAPEPEQDDNTIEAGDGTGEAEEGFVAEEDEQQFEVAKEQPLVTDETEFGRFLWEIDAEQERRGIPECERVQPRWHTLANGHTGGAIESSIIWRRPVDPDLIDRIRARLFDAPTIADFEPIPD